MNFIYVFLGGGFGAMARYAVSRIIPTSNTGFPLATFLANVISCIILGFLIGTLINKELNSRTQLILMTGFCGGFSTFSTFSSETYRLFEQGELALAFSYILASLAVCLLCIFIGIKLSKGI